MCVRFSPARSTTPVSAPRFPSSCPTTRAHLQFKASPGAFRSTGNRTSYSTPASRQRSRSSSAEGAAVGEGNPRGALPRAGEGVLRGTRDGVHSSPSRASLPSARTASASPAPAHSCSPPSNSMACSRSSPPSPARAPLPCIIVCRSPLGLWGPACSPSRNLPSLRTEAESLLRESRTKRSDFVGEATLINRASLRISSIIASQIRMEQDIPSGNIPALFLVIHAIIR